MPSEEKILLTMTGEPYQPARVYYQVNNLKTVLGAFKKLRCMEFDRTHDRWVWKYEAEARKLKFENSYNKIHKSLRPIALGYFRLRGDREMHLELRSFDRVSQAIAFFDKRINRRAAKAVKLRVVNRLFSSSEREEVRRTQYSFDSFFDREDVDIRDQAKFEADLERLIAEKDEDNPEATQAKIIEYLVEQSQQTLPEIQEVPIHFYEDGIVPLKLSLSMKTIEATEHWRGNTTFSQHSLLENMMGSALEELEEDGAETLEIEETEVQDSEE